MLNKTGVPTLEDIQTVSPSEERLKKGPVAIIECFQEIPCNPCTEACKQGAIRPMEDINNLPKLDFDKCNGCGVCLSRCPGLAIFIVDASYSDTEAIVRIPYEYYPVPQVGEKVVGLNRAGDELGTFEVSKVQSGGQKNKTYTIWLIVPQSLAMEVRGLRLRSTEIQPKETIVCRCEDITLGEIQALIKEGYSTIDEIKRAARAGMGPCQGRTCRMLIAQELAKFYSIPVGEVLMPTFRPTVKPVKLGTYAGGE